MPAADPGDYSRWLDPSPRREPTVYSECVIGYRRWQLADWTLVPNSVGDPWRPGINHARCRTHDQGYASALWAQHGVSMHSGGTGLPHAAPDAHCGCGLYALHDPLDPHLEGSAGPMVFISGAVAAWGRLEVHWAGFRAEYAQILALVPPPEALTAQGWEGLKLLQRIYQVPFVRADRLQAEAERHGRPLPVEARPPRPPRDPVYWPPLYVGLPRSAAPYPVASAMPAPPSAPGIPVATGMIMPPGKPPANRQGPPLPQRAPKKLFGRQPPGT
jgi:hypothetical protein